MSEKDILTNLAAYGLTNPNYSKTGEELYAKDGKVVSGIEGKDFTEATNDISRSARITLGFFLSKKTTDSKNEFPISQQSSIIEMNTRGEGASAMMQIPSDQDAFAKDSASQLHLKMTGLGIKREKGGKFPISSFVDDGSEFSLKSFLSKDASDSKKTGQSLLKSVPTEGVNFSNRKDPRSIILPLRAEFNQGTSLLRAIHQQLVDGNMFTPSPESGKEPFLRNPGGKNEEEITRGLFSIQRDLGSFDVNGERVQVSDMSAMAMAMLLKSVGNDEAASRVIFDKNLSNLSVSALKIVLRPAQIGVAGIGTGDFRISSLKSLKGGEILGKTASKASFATGQDSFVVGLDSTGNLVTRETPPNNENLPFLQSTAKNSVSHAQMNTFLEPFAAGSRFSSVGMFTMALASTMTMLGIAIVIDAIAGIASTTASPGTEVKHPSSLPIGSHRLERSVSTTFTRLLQVTQTDYDFSDCVGVGIATLYGLSDNSIATTSALSSPASALVIAENLVLAGGFYANFTRRLLSSATNVANIFSKIGFGNSVGTASAIEGVLRGIESLLDSPVYKFIMIAAGVGDAALKATNGMVDTVSTEKLLKGDIAVADDYASLLSKPNIGGQLGVYRNQIYRWGGKNTNALSLKTFYASQKGMPSNSNVDMHNRGLRPDRQTVQLLEDALESEYMPFYIHDLRTHELMSMPAFITEFSENFAANYNNVDGIGRQDPVRLYQKTERSVTLGFMLVAYNEEDHDQLWWTINKLVAMCYPQYSLGRTRTLDDGTVFTQPFSQVQAASPMVRLRLGDVFKSNYSKFGLSRLFDSFTSSEQRKAQEELDAAREKAKEKCFSMIRDAKYGKTVLSPGVQVVIAENCKPRNIAGDDFVSTPLGQVELLKGQIVTIMTAIPNSNDYNVISDKTGLVPIRVPMSNIDRLSDNNINVIVESDPDVIAANTRLSSLQSGQKIPNATFFKSDNNAIVRSFESTRGRGVAGFITSLGLDYGMNSIPWATSPGRKAPMVVKISMGFAPITDLPLGLDYNGNIRNPSHPVGNLAGGFGDVYYGVANENENEIKPMTRSNVNTKIEENTGTKAARDSIAASFNKNDVLGIL